MDGVKEEIEKINKTLGQDSIYKCVEGTGTFRNGYLLSKKR